MGCGAHRVPKRWPLLLMRGAAAKNRSEPFSPFTQAMSLDLPMEIRKLFMP